MIFRSGLVPWVVPVYRMNDRLEVQSTDGRTLVYFDKSTQFDDCVDWVKINFQQYKVPLTGVR